MNEDKKAGKKAARALAKQVTKRLDEVRSKPVSRGSANGQGFTSAARNNTARTPVRATPAIAPDPKAPKDQRAGVNALPKVDNNAKSGSFVGTPPQPKVTSSKQNWPMGEAPRRARVKKNSPASKRGLEKS